MQLADFKTKQMLQTGMNVLPIYIYYIQHTPWHVTICYGLTFQSASLWTIPFQYAKEIMQRKYEANVVHNCNPCRSTPPTNSTLQTIKCNVIHRTIWSIVSDAN